MENKNCFWCCSESAPNQQNELNNSVNSSEMSGLDTTKQHSFVILNLNSRSQFVHTEPEISQEEAEKAPLLIIKIIEGAFIQAGTILEINAQGYRQGLRRKRDGLIFFGSQTIDSQGQPVNDFLIPKQEIGVGNRHMVIKYQRETKSYHLKDLGDGTGTFLKISRPLTLKSGYIISFGDSHMVIQLSESENLALKFLDGPKIDLMFEFTKQDKTITIGRMGDCKIRFEDNSLSRYQCMINYVTDSGWVLTDGDGMKASTNGTWLFIDEFFEIYDQMLFKIGQTLLQCSLS